jgi:hypothetical protein
MNKPTSEQVAAIVKSQQDAKRKAAVARIVASIKK